MSGHGPNTGRDSVLQAPCQRVESGGVGGWAVREKEANFEWIGLLRRGRSDCPTKVSADDVVV